VFVSVIGVILSSVVILCIGTSMTINLFNRTINNEMSAVQTLVSWIHEQEEERLWYTIQNLSSKPELMEAVYADDVKKIMDFAQLSLRQINQDSIAAANAEIIRVLIIIIICSVSVMILVAIAAWIIGNRITRPIRNVTDYALEIADGNLDATISVKSNDEVGQLAEALAKTVKSLISSIRKEKALLKKVWKNSDEKMDLLIKNKTDVENQKPKKEKPDEVLLVKLQNACCDFDIDEVDIVFAEIDKYKYSSDDGLVDWLRDNVETTNFTEIENKLLCWVKSHGA